jgi:hypothetical protein
MKDWEDYEKERKDQIVSNIKRKGKYEEWKESGGWLVRGRKRRKNNEKKLSFRSCVPMKEEI